MMMSVVMRNNLLMRFISYSPQIVSAKVKKRHLSYAEIPVQVRHKPNPQYLHEHCTRCHEELGPIYRERFGPIDLLFVSDTKYIQTIIGKEGRFPHHNVPEPWLYYNRVKQVERGLFFQTGETWSKLRGTLNKVMLSQRNLIKFAHQLMDINSDFLNFWKASDADPKNSFSTSSNKKSQTCSQWKLIEDVRHHLCKWSIETTGLILFGYRMGCIQGDSRADKLVQNIAIMFEETSNLQLVDSSKYQSTESWNRFEQATTTMLKLSNEFACESIEKAKDLTSCSQSLLKFGTLSKNDIARTMVDFLIAAADTTSNSMQWMLYQLAKHQQVQNKIREEVVPLLDKPNELIVRDNAPYLHSFIREVMRLYPTAPFLARTLGEEVELGPYLIPADKTFVFSLFVTSRMDKLFKQPLEFRPERWLETNCDRYASLPFGIGKRNCIGRVVAELEMILFLASFVKCFDCRLLDEDYEIGIKLHMILCPDKPIRLQLRVRN